MFSFLHYLIALVRVQFLFVFLLVILILTEDCLRVVACVWLLLLLLLGALAKMRKATVRFLKSLSAA